VSEEETPFVKHAFLQQQDWDMFVQETNSPSFQQLGQEMKQKRTYIISHTRQAEKVIVVKGKSGRRRMQSSLSKENRTLGTNFLDVQDLICGQG
jgi:hypothetical protein